MKKPSKIEIRKPTKSISGVTPVAVMLAPRKCRHGTCVYCPSLNVPQSYTPKSPVVMRAAFATTPFVITPVAPSFVNFL
jgi:histone acetyltransferase (RNA polymerase elongator complex component)